MAQKQVSLIIKKMTQAILDDPGNTKSIISQYAKYLVKHRLVKNNLIISNLVLGAIESLNSEIPVLVTSAKTLSSSDSVKILDFIKLKFPGQNTKVYYTTKPEMIAGVKIDSRTQNYNFSLNRNLAMIRNSIK